ncbi:MAG TPA: response regulator transcription factor [Phycisphaerales bacterium]|nr:response regulator transcription factor [Phycisphaerales bacterium]
MPKPTSKASRSTKATPRAAAPATGPAGSGGAGIRVLCVDDHAVLVEGLKAQFAIDGRIRVVGRLATAEKLLDEVARLQPDVVLLDIEMPGPDVFEMADRLRRAHPNLRFVFLSAHIRDGYLASAYNCGAWGYFAKGDELEDIVAGIKELARSTIGTFVMGPKVRQRCAEVTASPTAKPAPLNASVKKDGRPPTPLESLTSRELEILRLIGKGLSRVEISKQLSRSAKTVDGHQERMMKKLGVESRADLMRFAIREGFAEA